MKEKTKIFLSLLAATAVGAIVSIAVSVYGTPNLNGVSQFDATDTEYVEMTISSPAQKSSEIVIRVQLRDVGGKGYSARHRHDLEFERDGTWYSVSNTGPGWEETNYRAAPGSFVESELNLTTYHGRLPEGHYRLIKQIFGYDLNQYAIAEFEIE